jgi:hypothetical protein
MHKLRVCGDNIIKKRDKKELREIYLKMGILFTEDVTRQYESTCFTSSGKDV